MAANVACNGRTRVMITVPDKILSRVDAFCADNGVTRSQFFCGAASDKLGALDASSRAVTALIAQLGPEGLAQMLAAYGAASGGDVSPAA